MNQEDQAKQELMIRAWAECKTDLEMELGLPPTQRAQRIEELIAQRHAELSQQEAEVKDQPEEPHPDGHA